MKKINTLIFTLLLAGISMPVFAVEQGFTYCYSCSESDKRNKAKAKLGNSETKHVTVINYHTEALDTYKVFKIVEPGLYQVMAQKINTDVKVSQAIRDVLDMVDLLKVGGLQGFDVNLLPNRWLSAFPNTAHDLVGNFNAANLLNASISEWISNQTSESFWGTVTFELREGIRAFTTEQMLGIKIKIEFQDGSHVTFVVKSISNGYGDSGLEIDVEQKPNSMFDASGNTLPDNPNLIGPNRYGFGGGADPSIALWFSMINRLNSYGGFRISCDWDGPNHVQCVNN